ncbi:MAG: nucleotidyltransferase family protein [Thermoplasmata archaeon]|nr:nucleotidyltransferase family protein [Thermoplasmata archaeon]
MEKMAGKSSIDKKDVKARLASNMNLMQKFGIKRLGLFGSLVRGEEKIDSDIDILVEFEKGHEKFNNLVGLHSYLQELLGRNIDLVTTGGLSPYLKSHILAEVEFIEAAS